jgi:hypothetical protein
MAVVAAGRGHTEPGLFYGFGSGMIGVLAVLILFCFVPSLLTGFFSQVWLVFDIMSSALISWLIGAERPSDASPAYVLLALGILPTIRVWSWFFATAVLAWEEAVKRRERAVVTENATECASSDQIRAMREARAQRR